MKKSFIDNIARKPRTGFLIAFFLLILSYFLTILSTKKMVDQANRVNTANQVNHELDKVGELIIRSVSEFRGYMLTEDSDLYEKFDSNARQVDSILKELRFMVADNPRQQSNMQILESKANEKIRRMRGVYDGIRKGTFQKENIKEQLAGWEKSTDSLFETIAGMQDIETILWKNRGERVSEYTNTLKILNSVSIGLATLLALFSLVVYNRESKGKKEQTRKATEFQHQLESRIEELDEVNKELVELRNLEKYAATGRIARTIAHEVRNPLTNINLSIEQLRSEVQKTDTTELFFKMLERNSDRINNLVSDLLNATRVSELKQEKVAINDLLEESLEMAHDRIELNHIQVVKNLEQHMCAISVDPDKIKVAFLNIIVNAIEAMDNSGTLTLKTYSENEKCVIEISDNGRGMEDDQVNRLFEPYFTTKEKGNGLGLANSQNIILSHNGQISVESEPNKGTTFTIRLNL